MEGGTKSQSFMVVTPTHTKLLELADKFGQSSIYISDSKRMTSKVLVKEAGQIIPIGKLCLASKNSTLATQLKISFIEDGKEYVFETKE